MAFIIAASGLRLMMAEGEKLHQTRQKQIRLKSH